MCSFNWRTFTDLTQIGCSDIFKLIGLDVINAGRRQSWGRGGCGVWVGIRSGVDGGRRPEFL